MAHDAAAEDHHRAERSGQSGGTAAQPPPDSWPTGRLLSAAARRVEQAWDAYLKQWGLTHATLPPLAVLARGPLSQREIASQLHVTEQTVGRVLRGLQQDGYINRQQHPADRRRHVVSLTDAGRRALAALDQAQAVESLVGSALSADETAQLRRLLLQMITALPLPDPSHCAPGDSAL